MIKNDFPPKLSRCDKMSKGILVGTSLDMGNVYVFMNEDGIEGNDVLYTSREPGVLTKYTSGGGDLWADKIFAESPEYYTRIMPAIRAIGQEFALVEARIRNEKSIVFEDDTCIICRDLKYKESKPYYTLWSKVARIYSIRDLSGDLNLLLHWRDMIYTHITAAEDCSPDQIRVFAHYYPRVWRLHFHINLIRHKYESAMVDYAFSLNQLIETIKFVPNFYTRATLEVLDRFALPLRRYMIEKYAGEYLLELDGKDREYQRLIRRYEVNAYSRDHKSIIDGRLFLRNVCRTYQNADITPQFRRHIKNIVSDFDSHITRNMRDVARRIQMYPYTKYPAFCEFDDKVNSTLIAHAKLFNAQGCISVIKGKMYLVIDGFNIHMWKLDIPNILGMNVSAHIQKHDRIHLIHSDVISRHSAGAISAFMKKYASVRINLQFDRVVCTYSLDWSLIDIAVMFLIKSPELRRILDDFNNIFGESETPTILRTFAVINQ